MCRPHLLPTEAVELARKWKLSPRRRGILLPSGWPVECGRRLCETQEVGQEVVAFEPAATVRQLRNTALDCPLCYTLGGRSSSADSQPDCPPPGANGGQLSEGTTFSVVTRIPKQSLASSSSRSTPANSTSETNRTIRISNLNFYSLWFLNRANS